MKSVREMFHHPGSCRSYPKKEHVHARTSTIDHRAHLATALGVVAANGSRSSSRLSSPPYPREGCLREADSDTGVRLCLLEDSRRIVFGDHFAPSARRVHLHRVMDTLQGLVLEAYDRIIGLELCDVAVDGCTTKALCGGERAGKSPVGRGKQGLKRSTVVDASGIPLGATAAPANRHDSSLLDETLDTLEVLGPLPEQMSVHLDRSYDSEITREKLKIRALASTISGKGKPAPLRATKRWVVERTNSWNNAHKKLFWCTERRGRVIDFWIAFSTVGIVVLGLI
jgi:DDE family transposase